MRRCHLFKMHVYSGQYQPTPSMADRLIPFSITEIKLLIGTNTMSSTIIESITTRGNIELSVVDTVSDHALRFNLRFRAKISKRKKKIVNVSMMFNGLLTLFFLLNFLA